MQAYRIDSARSFTATDLAYIRLAAGKAGEAIDTALRREQLSRLGHAVPGNGASGILVVHRQHGITYSNPSGQAWLEELSRLPADRETLLPSSIWAAISGIRQGAGMAVTTVPTRVGMVSIEASPGGDDGSVALVVSSPQASEAFLSPTGWHLTPAEERVAALVVQGQGNREIAEHLSVSEHTVEWHLRRIFEKVGVTSRVQLAARYSREFHASGVA
jgi:DNA-binding CsgD family transcriptional regulator